MWEDVKSYLTGQDIYFDTSCSYADLGAADITEIIKPTEPVKYYLVPIPRGKNSRRKLPISARFPWILRT